MPIDRAATLRNAEKLIRQGKLDAAIAEYVRLVEDQPQDWAAKNTLGDLYARGGHTDKAVHEFVEIANNLSDEGAMAKAGALYKKILKIKPDHEHSLMQVADLLAMQRAVLALAPLPDIVLVDAFRVPDLPMAQRGVLHGDRRCSAIAAASIVAKVTRDRQMLDLHSRDPRYGFDRHKGYATADHLDAVARFGYSDVHRRSFRPPTLFDTID